MSVPPYRILIEPVLRFLSEQSEPVRVPDVALGVSRAIGLSEEDLAAVLPNSLQTVFRNRLGWAHDRLKRAGLSASPRRGVWQLTDAGRVFCHEHATLTAKEVDDLAFVDRASPGLRPRAADWPSVAPADVPVAIPEASPQERIDEALEELHERVARELLELVFQSTPAFFEQLVLELLLGMGYGESRKALFRLGRSGDEGIDGVIALDKLGLDRVYVQAKKWKGAVGSPQIQAFMGALRLQGAEKGVLITPGDFTRDALEIAKKAHGNLVLIDGKRLADLMIEHRVGVQKRSVEIPQVDAEFFEVE